MNSHITDPLKELLSPLQNTPLHGNNTALLVVDMQYLCAHPNYGIVQNAKEHGIDTTYYERRLSQITDSIQSLLSSAREHNLEVLYFTIESLTSDGRDRSLEHKEARLHARKGSKEAQILEAIQPKDDDIVLAKTCSGVFNGTAIHQLLRNMKVENLIVTGVLTNQCVDTAVRDAADLGYQVTLVEDACAAFNEGLHQASIEILSGVYCRVQSTAEVLENMSSAATIK